MGNEDKAVLKNCLTGVGFLVVAAMVCVVPSLHAGQVEINKSVTVGDTIRMTTVPETRYAAEDTSNSRIALFSPDNKRFVIVTERGILETNEREFSLLLFASDQ